MKTQFGASFLYAAIGSLVILGCATHINYGFYGDNSPLSLDGWNIIPHIEHTSQVVFDTLDIMDENTYAVSVFAQRNDSLQPKLDIPKVTLSYPGMATPHTLSQQKKILLAEYPKISRDDQELGFLDELPETVMRTYHFYFDTLAIPENINTVHFTVHIRIDTLRKPVNMDLLRQQRKSYQLLLD